MRLASPIPRPALVAPAFLAGVWLASRLGGLGAPLAWLAAAALVTCWGRAAVAAWSPARWLALALACGGAAAAFEPGGPGVAGPESRTPVTVEGEVLEVEPGPTGPRFLLEGGGRRVHVSVRGALSPAPLPGDRARATGRLRGRRGYRNPGSAGDRGRVLAARGAEASMSADAADVDVDVGTGWSPRRAPVRARRALSEAIRQRGGDPEGNALARAMALGERGAVPHAAQERFRDAGIAHLLAVSGLHLGAVALLIFWIARRLWAAFPALAARVDASVAAAACAGGGAVFYTALTGARTSTMRALLVVLFVLAGVALCRRARFVDALGLAALVLAAMRPSILFEASFQLSFGAATTLALAMGGRRERAVEPRRPAVVRGLRWLGGKLAQLAGATAWVTAATGPLVLVWFGQVAAGGAAVNLAAVPASELVILPAALVGSLLAQIWPAAGAPFIDLAVWVAGRVDDLAGRAAGLASPLHLPEPNAVELAAWFAGLAAAILWKRGLWPRRRALIWIAGCAALIAGSIAVERWQRAASDELVVTFLDVGQGDAALVELPGGEVWLIDAGGLPYVPADLDPVVRQRLGALPGERAVLPLLRRRRIARIDRVIISHPHPDHFRGLAAVAGAVDIGEVWIAGDDGDASEQAALLARIGAPVVHPPLDRPLPAGDGATATVLAPRYLGDRARADPVVSVNDNSLVVRIEHAGRSLLFTGDIEEEGEATLVRRYGDRLRADVVKVPHHGSGTSSAASFAERVAPEVAVVSCGVANQFGFPDPGVIARWRAAGARVLRTDRHGAVTVRVSAGGALDVTPLDP